MKIVKNILLALLLALLVIQFFHPKKNISKVTSTNHISSIYTLPSDVGGILSKACYDCHSNNTRYPWYNNIQPLAWWLDDHVNEGKNELNFDEFATYRIAKQYHKIEEVIEQVKEGEMPLSSYTFIHSAADLNGQQRSLLVNWAESVKNKMKETYPADSLVRKKRA